MSKVGKVPKAPKRKPRRKKTPAPLSSEDLADMIARAFKPAKKGRIKPKG